MSEIKDVQLRLCKTISNYHDKHESTKSDIKVAEALEYAYCTFHNTLKDIQGELNDYFTKSITTGAPTYPINDKARDERMQ